MNTPKTEVGQNIPQGSSESTTYEAPSIESVVEAEDIEREVAYAGNTTISPTFTPL